MPHRIKLLGAITFEADGRPSRILNSHHGIALAVYLIYNVEIQSRESVADLLWEASSTKQSLARLKELLYRVRQWLPQVKATHRTVVFQPAEDDFIDLLALKEGLESEDVERLEGVLPLYSGDFLEGFYVPGSAYFNEWLVIVREQLRSKVLAAYRRVCRHYAEGELWDKGIEAAQRWLVLEPLDEEAHRWLIQALAGSGQTTAAFQAYESCRQILQEELGVEPEPATTALAMEVVAWHETAVSPYALDTLEPLPVGELPEPGMLPANALLPFLRNPDFVGREAELLSIASSLKEGTTNGRSPVVALTGMGGMGKTQTAVEFCYRYGRYFPGGVFWLNFAEADNVAEEVAAIGSERGLGLFQEADKLSQAEQVGRIQRVLQGPIPRLIVLDNCEDEDLLTKWLPVTGGCRVLLTSRRGAWARELSVTAVPLRPLTPTESSALLQRLASHLQEPEAAIIAEEIGHLPLALHLAGGFLRRYRRISAADYVAQLRQKGLLQHPSLQGRGLSHSPTGHEPNVARTYMINLQQLNRADEADEMAWQLLARAACFAPGERINRTLLLETITNESADMLALLTAEDGLTRLIALGFLEVKQDDMVAMHRLLSAFTHEAMDEAEIMAAQTAVAATVIKTLNAHKEKDPILLGLPFSPIHLRHVTLAALERTELPEEALQVEALQPEALQAARLASLWGSYLFTASEYGRAQPYLEKALMIRQRLLESTHPEVIESLSRWGRLCYRLGDYDNAAAFFKRVLAIRESLSEQDLSEMALTLRDLGTLYWRLAEYDQALTYHERELALRRQHFGPTHLLVAQSLSTLGAVYGNLGKYGQAKMYQEESLEIYEQSTNESEAVIARLLNNLSTTCYHQGDYATAREHMERTVRIREKIYPKNHPYLTGAMATLGYILINLGEFETARPYLEMALSIREEIFGRQHMHTVRVMTHWGNLLFRTGEIEAARKLLTEALEIQEKIKPLHGQTAEILNLLGEICMQQGALTEARPFLERALDIWSQLHKEDTLDTAHSLILLGEWHQANGDQAAARPYYQRATAVLKENALPTHNDYQRIQRNWPESEKLSDFKAV